MGLLVWTIIGIVVGFALAALLSRKLQHRIAPAVALAACVVAFAVARWADGQPSAEAPMLQAQAFIVGCALLGGVAGSLGWLVFARQRWAMIASAVASVALLAALPIVMPMLACTVAGICR